MKQIVLHSTAKLSTTLSVREFAAMANQEIVSCALNIGRGVHRGNLLILTEPPVGAAGKRWRYTADQKLMEEVKITPSDDPSETVRNALKKKLEICYAKGKIVLQSLYTNHTL